MDSAVSRVQFDYDLDDLADVSVRYFTSTRAGRVQRRRAIWSVGAGLVTAVIVVAALSSQNWSLSFLGPVAAVALPVAALVGWLYGTMYDGECRRRVHKFLAEEMGEGKRFTCEVELRPDGLWNRQQHMEMLHAWPDFVTASDLQEGLEFRFRGSYIL